MERVDEGGSGMKQSLLGCRMLTGMDAGWDAGCLLGWDAGHEKGQDTWSCFPRFLTIPGNILMVPSCFPGGSIHLLQISDHGGAPGLKHWCLSPRGSFPVSKLQYRSSLGQRSPNLHL